MGGISAHWRLIARLVLPAIFDVRLVLFLTRSFGSLPEQQIIAPTHSDTFAPDIPKVFETRLLRAYLAICRQN